MELKINNRRNTAKSTRVEIKWYTPEKPIGEKKK